MSNDAPTGPPAELVVVTVLAFATGVFDIVVGVVLMFLRYAHELEHSPYRSIVTITGAATVLLGLFVISLASGLTRGRRDARILLTILFSISFSLGLLVLVLDPIDGWFRFVDLTVSAGIVVVLWTGRVTRFFSRTGGGRTV
jgi:drug/metabolite transporter (DMT)-like permease